MVKIGILSDTHGYIDDRILHHLASCDQVWHAGDVGHIRVIESLNQFDQVQGVYGNIDGTNIRVRWPEHSFFEVDGCKILLIHIAGSAGRYNEKTRNLIQLHSPDILVCGHSHILKVQQDKRFNLLHINPGAAGNKGFHKVRTLILLKLNEGKPSDMKVIELGPRSTQTVD